MGFVIYKEDRQKISESTAHMGASLRTVIDIILSVRYFILNPVKEVGVLLCDLSFVEFINQILDVAECIY